LLVLASANALACSGRLHVELAESGVYALDYATIVAAQPALKDCRASDLLLLQRDREIPIRVFDDGHGGFGAGSRIEWLGEALHGPQSWFDPYSNTNVYQLAAQPGTHARAREVTAALGKDTPAVLTRHLHFEQEELMIRLGERDMKPGDEPDVWQWAKLTPIDAQPFAYDFDLPDIDARARGELALTLNFRGESNVSSAFTPKPADHTVEVSLNGTLVQKLEWDGRDELRRELKVPLALFKPQGNRLSLRVPRRTEPTDAQNFIIDVVMFNWAEVAYPIRGDLDASSAAFAANAAAPIELTHAASEPFGLFGTDGIWRPALALGGGRYRIAAAPHDVELYPAIDGQARKPARVRAVADSDWRAANPGYDYLIVAHPRLRAAIEPLAQYHREHGLRVAVIDVDEIYDQFSGGIAHPAAIRDLVAFGTAHWQVKPRYLLLVGDASVDIHHDIRDKSRSGLQALAPKVDPHAEQMLAPGGFQYMTTTAYEHADADLPNRNLIPTWQVASSSQGQSASDNPFVAIKAGDEHPQLAVGRFPVVTPAEVETIVAKTLAYLARPPVGRWHRDMTFISSSEVASFKSESDHLAESLESEGFAVHSVYTDVNDKDAEHVNGIRATLKQDLDDGNLLVHFIGHGGSFIWRVGPIGDLFALDDVSAMKNAGRYPMVLAMTCFSAPFDHPTDDSIGERFLREADKGAVAVFAASWSNWPNPAYSKDLIVRLLEPGVAIGDAIVAAKQKISDRTFLQMYNLLGDPALVLARPRTPLVVAPTGERWNPRAIVRLPGADFGGTVDVDWADAHGQIIASRHFEARDRQFFLPLLEGAKKLLVYATDTRTGAAAFGSYIEPDAPPPAPTTTKPAPRAALPPPVAAKTNAKPAPPRNAPDAIARRGFDSQAAGAAASSPRVH
jgi:hypothetical protein